VLSLKSYNNFVRQNQKSCIADISLKRNDKIMSKCYVEPYLMPAADMYDKWMELFETLDAKWQNDGRLQLNYVSALLKEKRYEEAAKILKPGFSIPDMKEADTDLSDIWFELYSNIITKQTGITDVDEFNKLVEEKYPLGDLDFRTH